MRIWNTPLHQVWHTGSAHLRLTLHRKPASIPEPLMQQPGDFFNLHLLRAGRLLGRHYPGVRLDIVEQDALGARILSDSEITITTTLLLVIVNVFFRTLIHPGILPGYGGTPNLSADLFSYPGRLPRTLDELLDATGESSIQPVDHQRALVSKLLADTAFDFLVLQLANQAHHGYHRTDRIDKAVDRGIEPLLLASDRAALGLLLTRNQDQKNGFNRKSKPVEPAGEEIMLLCFSLSMLFYIAEPIYDLPVAVRIVHAQQYLARILTRSAMNPAQTGCNEAILAVGTITRQPPNLDGFNGILHPASNRVLSRIMSRTR